MEVTPCRVRGPAPKRYEPNVRRRSSTETRRTDGARVGSGTAGAASGAAAGASTAGAATGGGTVVVVVVVVGRGAGVVVGRGAVVVVGRGAVVAVVGDVASGAVAVMVCMNISATKIVLPLMTMPTPTWLKFGSTRLA